jgi:hypothetical protein
LLLFLKLNLKKYVYRVFLVKKRLYRFLAATGNHNWPSFLKKTILSLNSQQIKSLGGIRPIDIKQRTDDVIIDQARGGYKSDQPTWKQQRQNQGRDYI